MTLREEIDKARSEFQRTTDKIMTADDIERIIDRIDDIEEIVIKKEFDIVTRLSKMEDELVNLNLRMDSLEFATKVHTVGGIIKITPDPEPQEPFSGYNELIKEAIPVLKAAIAKKKRELDQGSMTESEVMERHGWDLSAAHDFTGPGEHPEE